MGRDERKIWTEATMVTRHARLTVVTPLKFAFSQRKSPPITLALRVDHVDFVQISHPVHPPPLSSLAFLPRPASFHCPVILVSLLNFPPPPPRHNYSLHRPEVPVSREPYTLKLVVKHADEILRTTLG